MENNELKELNDKKEIYRNKAFSMMLEIGVIIAIPAIVAFFVGKHFDGRASENDQVYTLIALGIAFILSWTIIIYKYIRFDKRVKAIDKKIRDLKKQENDINDSNS